MLYSDSMFPPHIATWFKNRQLEEKTLEKFNVSWNGTHIIVPIKDTTTGKVLFHKFRRDPSVEDGPKYKNQVGSKNTLFNMNPHWEEVIICEGELDAMLFDQYGLNATTSTGGANAFPNNWNTIFERKKVYIFLDNDDAGRKGTLRVASVINHSKTFIIPYPRYFTGKDTTEYFKSHSLEDFKNLQKNAYHLSFFVDDVKDVARLLKKCVEIRRELYKNDLSAEVLEEYVRLLNEKKAQLIHSKTKIEHDDTLIELKKIPITKFITFNGAGFTHCLWHNEKTPSLFYYEKENYVHCFGCSKHADVIDVIRAINNCSFAQAIEILKKI